MSLSKKDKEKIEAEERYRSEVKSKLNSGKISLNLSNEHILTYNKILAWFNIATSWLGVFILGLCTIFIPISTLGQNVPWAMLLFLFFGGTVLFSFFWLKLSYDLLNCKLSGRLAMLVWSFFVLFLFPLGTIWGIWNFYFYNKPEVLKHFKN